MDAVKFLKARRAMCDSYAGCNGCPLHGPADKLSFGCHRFAEEKSHQAVSIVERWLKSRQDAVKDDAPCQPTPSTAVGRGEILDKARGCVCQDRNREYGEPEDGFKLIAALWEPVIQANCVAHGVDVSVCPETVALLMALLKVARAAQNPGHLDNWVDLAGYAACGGEIACRED